MGKGEQIIIFTFLLIFLEAAFVASQCNNNGPRIQCGGQGSNDNRATCLKNKRCCWNKANGKPNCFVNMGRNFRMDLSSAKSLLGTPPSRTISMQSLSMAAKSLNVSESERRQFEGRAGSFSMGNTMVAAVFGFPICPLKVPMCQRLRCQPYNAASERNPMECYKDPRCCFDAALFVHKYIFGESYMGNAPVCFLGPTSPRFVEITKSIQPWSPFYLEPVVRIFERYFDLNIDFNQATQCLSATLFDNLDFFRTPKCGWEGITKLECNLKGCCWNSKTGNCAYPAHLFGSRFGSAGSAPTFSDKQQFPELFQGGTTQCAQYGLGADPFEVFQRLPCGQGSPTSGSGSAGILDLYKTCPAACCKNMMALFPGVGDLSLSGSPSRQLFFQSQYTSYASNSLVNQAFVTLFCPYFYSKIPELGDLTESVKGCCKQTTCYHKSLGSGGGGNLIGGSWGNWGAWTSCVAACGVQGQRSRERYCMANGQLRDSSVCGGSSRETTYCTGDCTSSSYNWGQWGSYGACSGQCGRGGSQTRSRSCRNNIGNTGNFCPGSATETVGCTSPPCRNQCQWAQWSPSGACSISCYYGVQTTGVQQYSRACRTSSGQLCVGCPGTNSEQRRCSVPPCRAQCQWSQWAPSGPCSITCHSQGRPSNGVQSFRRQCQGSNQVCTGRCQGSSYRSDSCSVPQCQIQCQWGQWTPTGSCSISCYPRGSPAQGRQNSQRVCKTNTGQSCSSCPGSNYQTSSCSVPQCSSSYQIAGWGSWTRCDASCNQQRQQKCQLNGNPVDPTLCNAQVERKSCDFGLCAPSQPWVIWSAWSEWSDCTSNQRSQMRWRRCIFKGSHSIGDDICTCVYKNNPSETRLCSGGGGLIGGGGIAKATYAWSNWSSYSRCSGRCGVGLQTRTRSCLNSQTLRQANVAYCGLGRTTDSKSCFDALLCLFSG